MRLLDDPQIPTSDEERAEWTSYIALRPSRICLPPLRLSRVGLYLLIADLTILGLLVYSLQPLITLLVRNEELFAPRPLEEWNQTQHPIPMILHQTTANEAIPDKWVQSQKSCKEAYSNFEYKVCYL